MARKQWWMAVPLALAVLPALAQEQGQTQNQAVPPCPGMGPGMMGGGYGHHHGWGMGGGSGMGGGMMGGPGMGGGMMMGPGMMGGPGMGGGMMMQGLAGLDLTEEQRTAINKAMDETRKQSFAAMSRIADQQAQLRDLYAQEQWDADAITKVYDQIAKLRKQMIRARIQMRNQIWSQLNDDQRRQLRRWGPGWALE